MNLNEALAKLQQLQLPNNKYAVVGSATLAVRGIREANDLDVIVTDDLWNQLVKQYPVKPPPPCAIITPHEGIDILGEGSMYRMPELSTPEEIIETADVINGTPFINLQLSRKIKSWRNHEVDKKDVKLIDEYLEPVLI
jgi:hypothetical protein